MKTLKKYSIKNLSYIEKLIKYTNQSKQAKYNHCFVKNKHDKPY